MIGILQGVSHRAWSVQPNLGGFDIDRRGDLGHSLPNEMTKGKVELIEARSSLFSKVDNSLFWTCLAFLQVNTWLGEEEVLRGEV